MTIVLDGTTGITTPGEAISGNLSYTGTLTGGTGVVNLGSGQVYKDASGNVGIGTSSPTAKLTVVTSANAEGVIRLGDNTTYYGELKRVNATDEVRLGSYGSSQNLTFYTVGSERARIDSSGNLGLGVTPSAWISSYRAFNIGYSSNGMFSGGNDQLGLTQNAYLDSGVIWRYATANPSSQYTQTSGVHTWRSAALGTAGAAISFTESMRIDSSGNLLVGTTSGTGSVTRVQILADAVNAAMCTQVPSTSSFGHILFRNPNGLFGQINTSGTSTAYNTSSDYRLKEDITPMTGALAKVALLKPCTYKWKVDGSDGQGFIAHELAEVEAGCVTGEKDAVDADGNPQYQGIDTSFLVATLAAAIQEQQALIAAQAISITALNERLTALEAQIV